MPMWIGLLPYQVAVKILEPNQCDMFVTSKPMNFSNFSTLLVSALAIPMLGIAFQAQPTSTPTPALTATQIATQEDHKKMMDLLKITTLRKGADGRNDKAPNAANYDESKANPYPKLPDPLTLVKRLLKTHFSDQHVHSSLFQ